jgi:hypothetical protein
VLLAKSSYLAIVLNPVVSQLPAVSMPTTLSKVCTLPLFRKLYLLFYPYIHA